MKNTNIYFPLIILSLLMMNSCRFSQVQSSQSQESPTKQFFLSQNDVTEEVLEESEDTGAAFVFQIIKAQQQKNINMCLAFNKANTAINTLVACDDIEKESSGFDIVALDKFGKRPLSDERFSIKNSYAEDKCLSANIEGNQALSINFSNCNLENSLQNWLILPYSRLNSIETTPMRSIILAIKLSLDSKQEKIYCIAANDLKLELKPCSSDQLEEQHFFLQAVEK